MYSLVTSDLLVAYLQNEAWPAENEGSYSCQTQDETAQSQFLFGPGRKLFEVSQQELMFPSSPHIRFGTCA